MTVSQQHYMNGGQNLWSAKNGDQYATLVQLSPNSRNLLVLKRARPSGSWSTFDLSTIAANPLALPLGDDAHRKACIAVDRDGKIHIMANMHASLAPTGVHYVRSVNNFDITSWVDAKTSTTVGTNNDWPTYPQIVGFSDGSLLFGYRVTPNGGNAGGPYDIEKLAAGSTTWTGWTRLFDAVPPAAPYVSRLFVDRNDRVHLAWTWDTDASAGVNPRTDLSYIYSDDKGVTWRSVNGTLMTLPITTANHFAANVGINYPGFEDARNVVTDVLGFPHLAVHQSLFRNPHHIYWNGSAWVDQDLAVAGAEIAPTGDLQLANLKNDLWALGGEAPKIFQPPKGGRFVGTRLRDGAIVRFARFGAGSSDTGGAYETGGSDLYIDTQAALLYGTIEMFVPDGETPRVYSLGDGARRK